MASNKFDELTRGLATSTSRRETIKVLFASILGGALGFGGIGAVQAAGEDLRTESTVDCPPPGGCGAPTDTDFLWQLVQRCEANPPSCAPTTVVDSHKQWVLTKESQKNNYTLIAGQRVTGIECNKIWMSANPDYWAFALQAARAHLQVPPGKFGLAINAMGSTYRHSCQLHIHVSCIDTGVQNYLQNHDGSITTNPSQWNSSPPLGLGNPAHSYHVLHLSSLSSGGQNLFQLLKNVVGASNMQNQTLVVAARNLTGGGFYILSSDHTQGGTGGGENLLYEMC